jgi:hypothetical protein
LFLHPNGKRVKGALDILGLKYEVHPSAIPAGNNLG